MKAQRFKISELRLQPNTVIVEILEVSPIKQSSIIMNSTLLDSTDKAYFDKPVFQGVIRKMGKLPEGYEGLKEGMHVIFKDFDMRSYEGVSTAVSRFKPILLDNEKGEAYGYSIGHISEILAW